MAKLTLAELLAKQGDNSGANEGKDPRGTFKAPALTVTITLPDGTTVLETELEPRAFTPKATKNGRVEGGVGWYGDIKAKDGGRVKGLPISAGLRVSVAGLKIGPTDTVDISDEAE